MYHYKLVIFDWDGTLMDSIGRIVSSMQAAANDCFLQPPTNEQVKEIIGLSLPSSIWATLPRLAAIRTVLSQPSWAASRNSRSSPEME